MEIRKIKPEENVASSLIGTLVFLGTEPEDYNQRLLDPLQHSEGYEHVWAGFDDGGQMCARMTVHPYTMMFDGHAVGMGGIGGVGTLPECRNGGYVRRLLESVLPDMKERGMVFSFLYPFSYPFYRKFGYEIGHVYNQAIIPMSELRFFPYPDRIRAWKTGDDASGYAAIYEAFAQDKNIALVRNEAAWKRILDKDPYITRHYAYLHSDGQGQADAYVLCKAESEDGGSILAVRELAWVTKEGLYAMMGFIGGLSPQFEKLRWNMPSAFNIFTLFPDGYKISLSHPSGGMSRIIDLPRALELIKAPDGSGRVVLEVSDRFLPFNSGRYCVEWEGGHVSVQKTDREADMDTDITSLAQLVTGFLSPAEAQYKNGVTLRGNETALNALFTRKDIYIMEYF